MSLFSQRAGIQPLSKSIQRESMDDDLRNILWTALKIFVWDHSDADSSHEQKQLRTLVTVLWIYYFKKPIDRLPEFRGSRPSAYTMLRDYFYEAKWWQVYDFLEYIAKYAPSSWSTSFTEYCNRMLESENSAYRFVGKEIVEITDTHEIAAIESALSTSTQSARQHLTRALELLSDRKQPDFRNSIKESISGVESLCKGITKNPKGTLGECLKLLKESAPIHPALEAAFNKLYGYTSDEGGIRHAMTEESVHPSFSDAKFMLVACSAFNSFLLGKAAENNIPME